MQLFISVNGNDTSLGTVEQPLATGREAGRRAQPGDEILYLPGVYRPTARNRIDALGLPGRPIRIRAADPGTVTFDGGRMVVDKWDGLADVYGEYIEFGEGMIFQNAPSFYGVQTGGRGITVRGATIRDVWARGLGTWGEDNRLLDCTIERVGLMNEGGRMTSGGWPGAAASWMCEAMTILGKPNGFVNGQRSRRIEFSGLTIRDVWGEGLGPFGADEVTITGNRILGGFWSVGIYLSRTAHARISGNTLSFTNAAYLRNGKPPNGIRSAVESPESDGGPEDIICEANTILNCRAAFGYWSNRANAIPNNTYRNVRLRGNVVAGCQYSLEYQHPPVSAPRDCLAEDNLFSGEFAVDDPGAWAFNRNHGLPDTLTQADEFKSLPMQMSAVGLRAAQARNLELELACQSAMRLLEAVV